ncbi:MAG: DinB family protein [Planctomycetia bacterium]|nr:DinB family protein [Planctomycetia bacterium]
MIEVYLQGPSLLREAVAGMNHEQLLARPVPGKMSTLEVVAHLSDFEPILADRMKRIIALDRPALLGADENLFMANLAYDQRVLEEELRLIEVTRSQMARILSTLPASAWARVGVHSVRGEMSLEQMLNGAISHINHHLPFIAEKRRLIG